VFATAASALYIFFIISNNITGATMYTAVDFLLDSVPVSMYVHPPATTNITFLYNVPVYINESLASGEHTMLIQPGSSGNQVLMMFDYLIYISVSPSTSPMSTSPPSPTSSGTQGTPSGQNIGAIVGGTVGGVAALVLIAASLLCYRRYTRSATGGPPAENGAVVDPFFSSREVAPTSLIGTTSSTHLMG
ncbi:hypothetical protein J3R83DRAFT_4427, partial [Lanmaoa asiatica]